MNRSIGWCAVAVLALSGCKKKSEEAPPKEEPKAVVPEKAVEQMKPPEPKPATPEDLAKRYVECWGFWSAHDAKGVEGCYTKDATSEYVDSGMPAANGIEAIKTYQKVFLDAFPDIKGEPEVTLINGHNGVVIALQSGTHTGVLKTPMGDVPATKKKIGYQIAHAVHFTDDGKTADKEWFYNDAGTMMGQLGISKAPVRAVADKPFQANEVVIAKDDDAEKKNLETTKKGIEAFNAHDGKAMSADFADGLVWSEIGIPKDSNKAETVKGDEEMWKAFPDMKLTTDTMWAAGPYVVQTGTMTGTNNGDWPSMKLKKTGKPVASKFLQLYKYDKDGKLTNSWGFWNSAAFAQQLGMGAEKPAPAKK